MKKRGNWKYGYSVRDFLERPETIKPSVLKKVELEVHRVIMEHQDILRKCPHVVWWENHLNTCIYYIKAPIFRNCSLVANHFGPFSGEEVSIMMEETRDKIYRIEKGAIEKMHAALTRMKKECDE